MLLRNFFKNNIRFLINNYIPYESREFIGKLIRYFHTFIPYIVFFLLIFLDKKFIIYYFIFIILITILFILNDYGCILTFMENELLNDKYCIVNLYLNLLNLDNTKKNQIIFTLFFFALQIFLLIILYYIK
jgi:hypothetical protein